MEEATLEPPVLYLEGNAWPGDSLTEDGAAQITMYVLRLICSIYFSLS